MSNNKITDLVIRDDDKIIEYKDPKINKAEKKEEKNLTSLELYNKILQSDEFKRPITKEKVLEEDDYVKYLEEIISRDYFPNVYKMNQMKKEVNKILVK